MIVQVGGSYKTRDGNTVFIRAFLEGRFFGDIKNQQSAHVRVASFDKSGCYKFNCEESQFDIVEKT